MVFDCSFVIFTLSLEKERLNLLFLSEGDGCFGESAVTVVGGGTQ